MPVASKRLTNGSDPEKKVHGNLYVPSAEHRQLVEVLVAVGASHEAICRELVRLGEPCGSRDTLRRAFADELDHGKERRVLHYSIRVHAIAMGNSPQALPALRFMLAVLGGPQWRVGKLDEDEPLVPTDSGETVHIYMPPNHRDEPEAEEEGPIIEGEAEAA